MPIDYYCKGCGLTFSVGVYGIRGRYPMRRHLVCRACGTCHQLQSPMNEKNPIRFLAQEQPYFCKEQPHGPTFLDKRLKWIEVEVPAPDLERADLTEKFEHLTCFACKSKRNLAPEWEEDLKKCLHCQKDKLIVTGGWIT